MAFEVTSRIEESRFGDLMAIYSQGWWTARRTREQVRRMLAESDVVFGVVDTERDRLVGFARILTDFVFRAHVQDVIVLEEYRGRGVSRLLMDAAVSHPRLKDVEMFELTCKPGLVPLYEKWGFTTGWSDLSLMARRRQE